MSVFFFKQKTAYEMRISDWSSDVCSSDLPRRVYRVDCREVIDELLGKDLPQFRPEVSADPRDLRRRPRRRLGRACSKAVDQRRMRQVGALRVDTIAGRSEGRRGGTGSVSRCESRGSPEPEQKKK